MQLLNIWLDKEASIARCFSCLPKLLQTANYARCDCREKGLSLTLPVGILHAAAFTMGYWLCKGLKFNEKTCRTVSIETGIVHSTSDAILASLYRGRERLTSPETILD